MVGNESIILVAIVLIHVYYCVWMLCTTAMVQMAKHVQKNMKI